MKIIVTGGAGLIGFEVCKQLLGAGHEVHLFDLGEQILRIKKHLPASQNLKLFCGSIFDLSSLRLAMKDCEIVIHLAALLGVKRSEEEKLSCLEINIIGTKNVLDCAVQQKVRKIVFSSSSEVYGEPLSNPVSEEAITQGKTVYAITKLAGEELCKGYSQEYPLKYTILRYFNCYGPFQTAQFVLPKFIKNVMENKPPVIFGDGEQIRSYTYVSDTAKATVLAALSDKADGQILNIGNGREPISLKDLASLVIEILAKEKGLKPEFRSFENSDRRKEREIVKRFCSSEKAEKLLGWKPEVSLREGIKKVFEAGVIFERWANLYDEQN